MAITKEDLQSFVHFAEETMENGGVDSLVQLAREWESRRGPSELTLGVEIDEKTARWLVQFFPDVNDDERLKQALARRGGVTTAEMLSKAAAAAKDAGRE